MRLPLGERERQRLQIVVAQHEVGDLVGHAGEEAGAGRRIEPPVAHRRHQRDLDVDLDVGGVHAGRVVDGVGVEPHPAARRLDAPALGDAEIGALADHLGANVRAGDADGVVGAVAGLRVGLARRADIGADAAEPEQVDRRLEDGAHQFGRRSRTPCRSRARRGSAGRAGCSWRRAGTRRRLPRSAPCHSPARRNAAARTAAGARPARPPDPGSDRGRCRDDRRRRPAGWCSPASCRCRTRRPTCRRRRPR